MRFIKNLTDLKITHNFLNGNHSVLCIYFGNIELIVALSQPIPKSGLKTGIAKEQDFHVPRTSAFNN